MFDATMNLTSFAVCNTQQQSESHIQNSDQLHFQSNFTYYIQVRLPSQTISNALQAKNYFIFIHSASNQFFLDSHSFRHLTTFSDFYLFRHLTIFQIFTYSAILPFFRFSPITPSNHFLYFLADFYSFLHFLLISSHLLDFSKSVKIVMTCEK